MFYENAVSFGASARSTPFRRIGAGLGAQRHHEATRARWCPSAARLLLRAHSGAGGCSVHELRPRAAPRFHRMPRSANESTSAAAGETDADAIRAEHERRSFAQRQHRGGVQAIRECRRHYGAELWGRERVLDGCVRHGHQDQPECGERAHDRRYPRRRAEGPAGVHRPQQDAPRRHLSRRTRLVEVSSARPPPAHVPHRPVPRRQAACAPLWRSDGHLLPPKRAP